jgi:hypothetical protein
MKPYARMSCTFGLTALVCACSETLPPTGATQADPAGASATSGVDALPCDDAQAWQEVLGALRPAAVQDVTPTYIRDTCAGSAQVSGTKLALSPDAVASPTWALLLACRNARVHLGEPQTPAQLRGSPRWTPDGWVGIAVERDGKKIVLTLHAESVSKNIRLFRSAAAFLAATRD